jgi:hypothetical protein
MLVDFNNFKALSRSLNTAFNNLARLDFTMNSQLNIVTRSKKNICQIGSEKRPP